MQGHFGASTPDLLHFNPPSPSKYAATYTGPPMPYTALCAGTDFVRNHATSGIDFATTHLWPEMAYVCSDECRIENTRAQLRAQLAAASQVEKKKERKSTSLASQIGKPLVVEEFGYLRPVKGRNEFYSMVFEELLAARDAGLNVGGSLFWMMAAPTYPDYDGTSVWLEGGPYFAMPSRPYTAQRPTAVAQLMAQFAEFMNYEAQISCLARNAGNGTEAWSAGWEDTLKLIWEQREAMAMDGASW